MSAPAKEHLLKTYADYWDEISNGNKPFEVRRDDRGFQKGDILILRRTIKHYTHWIEDTTPDNRPRDLRCKITYILTGGQFGIEPGYVVMGLRKA